MAMKNGLYKSNVNRKQMCAMKRKNSDGESRNTIS